MPFEIRAAGADPRSAEVLIYGDIGASWWDESVEAKAFAEALMKIDADYITARINSYGGSVSDGLAIFNALRRHPAAITTEVDGVAVSIASLIAMAGDTVRIAENGLIMVHAPWTVAAGNSLTMREAADVLDRYAKAMVSSYKRSGAIDEDTITGWLTDGQDHWFTADEALAAGLVDEVTGSLAIAASLPARFRRKPVAAATQPNQEATVPVAMQPQAAANEQPNTVNVIELQAKAREDERAELSARNSAVKSRFDAFCLSNPSRIEELRSIYDATMGDITVSAELFTDRVLAALAKAATPLVGTDATRIEGGMDEREKFRAAATSVIAHRMGISPDDRGNELRGMALHELAARSLVIVGTNCRGMTKSEIASKVLAAHSTSDFPYLLANTAEKSLQAAYGAFPSSWPRIAAVGEVSDFKTIDLIRLGSFNSLDLILEGAEYTAGTFGEEREQMAAQTKGKFIQLTRQMIINDDLSGFSRMTAMLGRAAARTVNKDVITVINTNGTLSDGVALFATTVGNLASSGAAITVASLGAGRAAMRMQMDSDGNDYLNIMPRTLLVPVALEDHARTVLTSEYNTDTAGQLKRNIVSDWGPLEVVSDPYLDAVDDDAWYLIADPMDVPLIEVRFLDGNQTPYIDTEEEFLTDAIRWKVRLDYGVAANDRRGGYKDPGPT